MTIECPTCRGRGKLMALFPLYAAGVPPEERPDVIDVRCSTCLGAGTITRQRAWDLLLGDFLRRSRLNCGLGLRSASELLGVAPSEWSRLEQGFFGDSP